MTRGKIVISLDGMAGPVDRLLDWLREGGYTVALSGRVGHKVVAEVEAPHGEVDARPHYLGAKRRRGA